MQRDHETAPDFDATPRPWYRHPMVWLVIAIPVSAMLMGGVQLTLAIRTPESVVRADYYQAGRAINIDLREIHRAADLGITATFHGHPDDGWLLDVRARRKGSGSGPLEVLLAHPTLAARDVEFDIDGDDGWQGSLGPLEGRHMLSIRSPHGGWLLREEVELTATGRPIRVAARPWEPDP